MRRTVGIDLELLLAVSLWSLDFSVVKAALAVFHPLAFAFLRFGIAAVAMVLISYIANLRLPPLSRRDIAMLGAAALTGIAVNQSAMVIALSVTSASGVALLMGTIPLWTALVAVASGLERHGLARWAAILVGFFGTALIVVPRAESAPSDAYLVGSLFALLAAASWGTYTVLIRQISAPVTPVQLSGITFGVGAAALLPIALPDLMTQDWKVVPFAGWGALGWAALISVGLGNILYFKGVRRSGASTAAMYTYLEPVLGVVFAMALLGDRPTLQQAIGGVAVIAAVIFGQRLGGEPRSRTKSVRGI